MYMHLDPSGTTLIVYSYTRLKLDFMYSYTRLECNCLEISLSTMIVVIIAAFLI